MTDELLSKDERRHKIVCDLLDKGATLIEIDDKSLKVYKVEGQNNRIEEPKNVPPNIMLNVSAQATSSSHTDLHVSISKTTKYLSEMHPEKINEITERLSSLKEELGKMKPDEGKLKEISKWALDLGWKAFETVVRILLEHLGK